MLNQHYELTPKEQQEIATDLLTVAARSSGKEGESMERAWLVFSVSLAYILRKDLLDPLQVIEEIYADFNYPEELVGFIRYMPMQGPNLGSREANENRMFERWRSWVVENNPHVTIP